MNKKKLVIFIMCAVILSFLSVVHADVLTEYSTTSCPLITTFIKSGAANNNAEVAKLQSFLKNAEHLDVNVTGTFDAKTEAAVKAFQIKYMSDIMGPWGATQSSGIVYITTAKKINELVCASSLTLDPAEMSIINDYKMNISTQGQAPAMVPATSGSMQGPSINSMNGSDATGSINVGVTPDVGSSIDQSANTAAVGNTSLIGRFWNFLKFLF